MTSTRGDRPGARALPNRGLIGAVLVGGQSRRMGRDKARLLWAGEPLASHVAARVRAACGQVVLVGGAGRNYEDLGWPWWPDPPGLAGAGPMAGLLMGLALAERVLLVACDLPAIEPWLLRQLIALGRGRAAAIPVVAGRLEPLCAVYGREVLPAVRASIAIRSGRMSDLLAVPGVRRIPEKLLGPPAEVARQMSNINNNNDLETFVARP